MTEKTSLYASIVLPVPLNTPFTYAVPQELSLSVEVGRRALVPFGKRILTGFIINILTDPGGIPLSKLKPILNILDDEQVFDTHMLTLARWVAEYYFASLGEVLKTAMPYGTMIKSRIRVHLVKPAKVSDKTLTSRQREVLEQIRKKDHTLLRNFERSSKEPVLSIIYNLEKKGFIRIEREVNVPSVRPKTTRYIKPAASPPETSYRWTLCSEQKNARTRVLGAVLRLHMGFSKLSWRSFARSDA